MQSSLQLYEKLFRYFKMWAKLYVWARVCCVVTCRVQNSWRPGRWTYSGPGTSTCSEGEPQVGTQQRYTVAQGAKCALATESWTKAACVCKCEWESVHREYYQYYQHYPTLPILPTWVWVCVWAHIHRKLPELIHKVWPHYWDRQLEKILHSTAPMHHTSRSDRETN
jgi:hypothetical protein